MERKPQTEISTSRLVSSYFRGELDFVRIAIVTDPLNAGYIGWAAANLDTPNASMRNLAVHILESIDPSAALTNDSAQEKSGQFEEIESDGIDSAPEVEDKGLEKKSFSHVVEILTGIVKTETPRLVYGANLRPAELKEIHQTQIDSWPAIRYHAASAILRLGESSELAEVVIKLSMESADTHLAAEAAARWTEIKQTKQQGGGSGNTDT